MSKSITLILAILFIWVISWGCEHWTYYEPDGEGRSYIPEPIPIRPGMILKPGFKIAETVTVINAQTNTDWVLLGAFTHRWWGNLRVWTDTAVSLVKDELKKRGVAVKDELPLILKLEMIPDEKSPAWVCTLARGCLLDTDGDGIPQYMDRCPNTPQGARVNRRGCPLDTDRDGIPDPLDMCPTLPRGVLMDGPGNGKNADPGMQGKISENVAGAFYLFVVSSRSAATVMGLFRKAVQHEGISISADAPDLLRFNVAESEWSTRFKSIQTALKNQGIQLTEELPKILQLSITRVALIWDPGKIGCDLNLRAVTGDGYIFDFKGTNYAIDLHNSCDGAITREVTALFNDARMRTYLAAPTEPRDSDCDGVPDEMDECPETPRGVEVDGRGCPKDTDGDGVADYRDECPGTPKGIKVDRRGCPLDSDGDGVPDSVDECPDTPKGVQVDKKGCPLDSDSDGVADWQDKCPGTPKGARVDAEGCWTIDEAFFDFGKYEIHSRFYPIFDEVVEVLNKTPSLKIMIEGYTDNIGTEAYNQKLSEERARAVKRYLVKKGIQSDRLFTAGFGYTKPKASNTTNAGRALNRRVKLEPLPTPAK